MRRLYQCRASAPVAVAVVVATVLWLIGAGEFRSWRDQDSFVRQGRGSSQRLRTADAIAHDDESTEPLAVAASSGQLGPDAPGAVARVRPQAPPGYAIIPLRGPHFGPQTDFVPLPSPESFSPDPARPVLPAPGRAPPLG